ncbi:MFS transporter [Nocardioides cynanchi]|uniref:MFS transporter n=1 Tax=Nocardioides cynanchi TaxID=2558918 RepID=UPI00192E1091|nr:MFS transporter [Nocardioides cynanchi]
MTADDARGRWIALAVCCSAMFMTLLDVSVTNVALPSIRRDLGTSTAELQWIVSGYILAFGLVPVLGGKLGDDHGRRRMFQVGVAGFALASLLSGLAPTAGVLIGARVVQGLFGGLINPQTSGLLQQMFRGSDRGRAFGVLGTTVGLGTAIGPLVGGALIALGGPTLGWRLVFFVNIPVGIVVLLLSRRYLPATPRVVRHRLDLLGAALLGSATFSVLIGCVEYDSHHDARLAWLAVPAAVLFSLFLRRERRLTRADADPLVDLRLFHRPSYVAGITLALTFFPAMAGLPLVLAIYYQDGLGYTALQSALGVTAYAVGSAVSAPLSGRVVTRVGRPLVVGGAVTFGLGAVALALVAAHVPTGHAALALALPLFVMGCGQGALITPNQTLALMDVDPAMGSTAGGVLQTGQRIGLAIGQAVIGAVFFASLTGPGHASYSRALGHAVIAAICFVSLAITAGVWDLVRANRRSQAPVA